MAENGMDPELSENSLLKNILTIADDENTEVPLVDLYRDLIFIGEKLKRGVQHAVERDARAGHMTDEEEEEEESEEEEEDEQDDDDGTIEEDSEDEETIREKTKKKPKQKKTMSDIEQLLESLSLDKKQKQHLLIKKAILLKFEEALFGNNNITMTLDLRQVGEGEKEGKLEQILQCKDLSRYIPRAKTEEGNSLEFSEKAKLQECVNIATNPVDILKALRPKTPKKIATNLIKQQYNIRWNTKSGEARPFDFFSLEKHFRKGIVRKAYVQTLLYEHKVILENLRQKYLKYEKDVEAFAPKFVFGKKDPYAARQDAGDEDSGPRVRPRDEPKFVWQKWTMLEESRSELGAEFPTELRWIEPKVKTLLRKLCEPLDESFNPYETPNVMYILVVKETTSETLCTTGNQSQIYIGAADDGIKKRFLEGDDAHCLKMKMALEETCRMEAFSTTSTALLIELRLLLAHARQEPFALFAVQVFDAPRTLGREVHDLITKALYLDKDEIWGPSVNMLFGLNVKEEMKKRRKFLPDHFPGSKKRRK